MGCGEGACTELLAERFPQARIVAIDIADDLGRQYAGRVEGVIFKQITVQDLALTNLAEFDVIIICDVMHHVPQSMRPEILRAIRQLLAPNGSLQFKDWARRPTPIHWACYSADRWLTGDRVSYMTKTEARHLLDQNFPNYTLVEKRPIGPWSNNYMFRVCSTV